MSEQAFKSDEFCKFCKREFSFELCGIGRKRKFCSDACKMKAYRKRKNCLPSGYVQLDLFPDELPNESFNQFQPVQNVTNEQQILNSSSAQIKSVKPLIKKPTRKLICWGCSSVFTGFKGNRYCCVQCRDKWRLSVGLPLTDRLDDVLILGTRL